MEKGLTRQEVIAQLIRSPHGSYESYLNMGIQAAKEDPEFFAHLIAWDAKKGELKDTKAALPIIALGQTADPEFRDNAFALMANLSPRDLIKALKWTEGKLEVKQKHVKAAKGKKVEKPLVVLQKAPPKVPRRALKRFISRYLANLESNRQKWDRYALQDKASLHFLYRKYNVVPGKRANGVLFGPSAKRPDNPGRPQGSVFERLPLLKTMDATQAAGTIMADGIPFLAARGAVGEKAKDPIILQALIGAMSPAELINNSKLLEEWGMKDSPALRAAYEKALEKAGKSKKATATLKAGKAVEAVSDEKLKAKLTTLQEKKLDAKAVKGNWLVLADASTSMDVGVEVSKHVASVLARLAEKVYLIFFTEAARRFEVTGMTLEQIQETTKRITAHGWTSIGVGVSYAIANNLEVDGIAIISDGAENKSPHFVTEYQKLCQKLGKDIPVYYYAVKREPKGVRYTYYNQNPDTLLTSMEQAKLAMDIFPLDPDNIDYYSLPNLVQTMRTNRYSLVDEIMDTPLRRLDDVFKATRKEQTEGVYVNAE